MPSSSFHACFLSYTTEFRVSNALKITNGHILIEQKTFGVIPQTPLKKAWVEGGVGGNGRLEEGSKTSQDIGQIATFQGFWKGWEGR